MCLFPPSFFRPGLNFCRMKFHLMTSVLISLKCHILMTVPVFVAFTLNGGPVLLTGVEHVGALVGDL